MMIKRPGLTLTLLSAGFMVLGFFNGHLLAKNNLKSEEEPQQQIMDFSLSGFGQKGKKSWDVSGKSADMSSEVIKLKDIVSNLYGENEDVKLTAQEGNFDKSQGRLHLQNDVVITTSTGTKLTTDSLDWDRKSQIVSTLDKVNIERENMVAVAQGATGNPDLNKINLEKNVQIEIKPAQESKTASEAAKNKITITCDGPLEIDYQKNVGVFKNKVKVETSDINIESDTMEVYFVKGSKDAEEKTGIESSMMGASIEKVIARGNVRITREQNTSFSDEAVYSAQDKKITLLGKPRLVVYSTEDLENASSGN